MSKYVKDLVTRELKNRFDGVSEAILVNVVGLDANRSVLLRRQLREKGIHLMVVKNSLAQRATEGTALGPAFKDLEGSVAVCWGGADIGALAKEVARLAADQQYAPFAPRGGILDGKALSAEEVEEVSRWPTREEQLALLMGQCLAPAANLSSQLLGPAAALASQIAPAEDGTQPDPGCE